jgi:hypothetical protein
VKVGIFYTFLDTKTILSHILFEEKAFAKETKQRKANIYPKESSEFLHFQYIKTLNTTW